MTQYINPTEPIYISYTGKDKAIVNDFIKTLQQNNIYCRCSAITNDFSLISEFEEEIGKSNYVIIFYSPDYFKSYHCMNEYALIRQNEDKKRIKTYRCVNFKFDDIQYDLIKFWGGEKSVCKEKGYDCLDAAHKAAWNHDFYIGGQNYNIRGLSDFFRNRLYDTNLNTLVSKIETEIKQAEKSHTSESLSNIHNKNIFSNYHRPINKSFCGRDKFVDDLYSDFNKGYNLLNVYAPGGMGKTSVSHIYIDKYGDKYNNILFITSNDYLKYDFSKQIIDDCKLNHLVTSSIQVGEMLHIVIDYLKSVSPESKNLLCIDINIIDKDHFSDNHNFAFLEHLVSKWHILLLTRNEIKDSSFRKKELSDFRNDMNGARSLFKSVYEYRSKQCPFTDDELNKLIEDVYYHPLLIEQLAFYGIRKAIRDIADFNKATDLTNSDNEFIENQNLNEEGIALKDKYGHLLKKSNGRIVTIYDYLHNLISFDYFDNPLSKCVLKHFMLWQYDYVSFETISLLLRGNYTDERMLENELDNLVDNLILLKNKEKQYRLHSILAYSLRNEKNQNGNCYDTFISNGDYDTYITNIQKCELSKEIINCIVESFDNYFVCNKEGSIYSNINYWQSIMSKCDNTNLQEFAYKILLLNRLYPNVSPMEIRSKVKNYKGKSSHLLYYDWLDNQSDYVDGIVPTDGLPERIANIIKDLVFVEGGTFNMGNALIENQNPIHLVKLSDYYMTRDTISVDDWTTIMQTTPFRSNENRISWYDCIEFIIKINSVSKMKFRLPTETEWEYSARGGKKIIQEKESRSVFHRIQHFFKKLIVKYLFLRLTLKEKYKLIAKIMDYDQNKFNMKIGKSEWCSDWYGSYTKDFKINPTGMPIGTEKVGRGGMIMYIYSDTSLIKEVITSRGSFFPSLPFGELRLVISANKDKSVKTN